MSPVAEVNEIFPAQPDLDVFEKNRVGDRRPVLDQVPVPAPPSQLLRDEYCGERVRAQLCQLSPGDIFDDLAQAHRSRLGTAERGIERLLVDGQRVPGFGDRGAMRRVLHRVREHKKARLRFRPLFVLLRGIKSPSNPGGQAGRPHPKQEEPARLSTGGAGPVDPAVGVGRVVHPDRRCRSRLYPIMVRRGEFDALGVQEPLHDLATAAARLDHPVDRVVVDEPDPVRPVLVKEFLIELFQIGMQRL